MAGLVCSLLLVLVTSCVVPWVNAKDWNCGRIHSTVGLDNLCSDLFTRVKLEFSVDRLEVECVSLNDLEESNLDTFAGINVNLNTDDVEEQVKSSSCTTLEYVCALIVSLSERFAYTSLKQTQPNNTKTNCSIRNVLQNVKHISVIGTSMVSVLPTFLDGFDSLVDLDLRENRFQKLPPGLFNSASQLKSLDLGDNEISDLDPNIFKNLTKLESLHLCGNPLVMLPNTLFHDLANIKMINLYACSLQSLPPDIFLNTHKLTDLNLFKNSFTSIPEGLFRNTPLLKILNLFDNGADNFKLPAGLLSHQTYLQVVDLSDDNLIDLPEDLLRGSTSLVELILHHNKLTTLPRNLLVDAIKLEILDLSSNDITSIPDGAFSSLTSLKTLDLSYNQLVAIQQLLFRKLLNLTKVDLQSNQLKSIHSEAFPQKCFILELNLSSNQLSFNSSVEVSPFNHCRLLDTLSMANNSLSTISQEWNNMDKLTYLDLSDNDIAKLTYRHLDFFSKRVELNLINNKIRHINVEMVDTHSSGNLKSVHLKLKGNPIACDCTLHRFLELIEKPSRVNVTIDNVICSAPSELSGRLVREILSTSVACDMVAACPEPCTCQWRPSEGALIVNCSDQGLVSPPNQLPWNNTWRYTEVHLERNRLESLPNMSQPGYAGVTKVFAAHNNIARVDPHNLSPKLQVLELNDNKLTTKGLRSAFEFLSNKKWNFTQVKLGNNEWLCDCNARDLLHFLHTIRTRTKVDNVTCSDGRPMMPLSPEDICTTLNKAIIAISTCVAVVGLLVGALASLYLRYSRELKVWLYSQNLCLWFVTEEELDKDKEYDAFICYSHKDSAFVENVLVPGLESGTHRFKVCLHIRDWVPGEWITTQIVKSVESSRRTVIVLSPNFLESVWGLLEFRTAQQQTISDGRTRVIVIIYGDVGHLNNLDPELQNYISMNTYIKWDDPWFWKKMHFALPHSNLSNHSRTVQPKRMVVSSKDSKTHTYDEIKSKSVNMKGYIPGIKDPNSNIDGHTFSAFPRLKTVNVIENEYIF